MSKPPSAGWRAVYRWCHVAPPDGLDELEDLDDGED